MVQFYFFILFYFVSGACNEIHENYFSIVITKNEIVTPKIQMIITSKEITVVVYKSFPDQKDDVTLDQLTCYDNKSNDIIFSNPNFSYIIEYLDTPNKQYLYQITQKLKIQRGSNGEWRWLCKLYVHWDGCYKTYECEVDVEIKDKNETTESTSKDTRKPESQPAELKAFSGRSRTEQTVEPKPRDQKCINQKPTETKDGVSRDSSKQVVNGKISTTIWVIFILVVVVIFVVGLVIGAICRRPPEPLPEPVELEDLSDEHIYEEVIDKGFKSYRPPPPIPEKKVSIYNVPYDHTPWFKNIGKKKRQQSIKKNNLIPVET